MNAQKLGIVLSLVLVSASHAASQEKRPVSFEDILSIPAVSAPVIAPDGASVLYTLTGWEEADENGEMSSVSHVFRIRTDGSASRQLTFGEHGESQPRFSPDGETISFLARRGGEKAKTQIWILRSAGGEATALTDTKEGVNDYAWSPDGRQIAFTARDELSAEDDARKKKRDDPLVYEGDPRMRHLWVVDVATEEAVRHTSGSSYTVKGRPSWSASGSQIAFTAAPTMWIRDGRDDVYIASLVGGEGSDGSKESAVEKITTNPGPDASPVWSPDGKTIAYLSTPNDSEPLPDGTLVRPLANARLMMYDVKSGEHEDAAHGFDRIPSSPYWTPDSARVLISVGDGVYREIYAYHVERGAYEKLTNGAVTRFGGLSRDGSRAAFTSESGAAPPDVFLSGTDFQNPTKLTTIHPDVDELALGETEVVTWKSTDGLEVEGVLLKPVGYRAGERYPLMVVAHGGPTGAHHDQFRVRYGDGGQHWAGQGWAVLYPNPRGSTNYGEAFMRGNLQDWGGGDYRDIMTGVDALIERGIAHPEKLAFQGWSYGGYMTCWTVSQTTRFKAAMIGAGLTNLVSMYGTNDIPNYLGTFFGGTLSPETEHLYRERSGLSYADQVTTPTLILHGGNDERVPVGQPMEFFRALKDRGVPVELVFYPREGHGLREYYHRLDRMTRQFEWIERHTLGEPATN